MSGTPSILRVLEGKSAGATASLPASGRILVGHEFWHDVVLRDPSTRGCAVELTLDESGAAHVTVLEGEARVLGAAVQAGSSAVLPPYVPLRMGQVAFAWGEAESPRWDEARSHAASEAVAPTPKSEQAAVMETISNRWKAGPEGAWKRFRRPALFAGIAAAAALLIIPPAVDAIQYGIGSEYRARRALDTAGYKKLVVDDRNGALAISGTVRTENDRMRVQQVLEAADVDATIDVQSGASLARAAADVARLNGVQAVARTEPDGAILLATPPIDDSTRDKLAQIIKRDVPGLKTLRFGEELAVPRTVSEATKRVASVVTGDPPYILTDDGARYFSGALLPSGYYLVGIQGNQVLLDRRGKRVSLKF